MRPKHVTFLYNSFNQYRMLNMIMVIERSVILFSWTELNTCEQYEIRKTRHTMLSIHDSDAIGSFREYWTANNQLLYYRIHWLM